MRELDMHEIEAVSGGDTNWQAVGTTLGLSALAITAAPLYPVAGTTAAVAAAATGVYSAYIWLTKHTLKATGVGEP